MKLEENRPRLSMTRWSISTLILCMIACTARSNAIERSEVGALVMEGIPPIPQEITERIDRYLSVREAVLLDWTPSGSVLFNTRFGDTAQLHLVDRPMGLRRQLTFFPEPVTFGRFSPSKRVNGLVFFKDKGGDENFQLYFLDRASGRYDRLTYQNSRSGFAVWSNKGTRVAYYSNQRNGVDWDVYITRPHRADAKLVLQTTSGAWLPLDWSPDDNNLLILNYISINEASLYVADLVTGKLLQVEPNKPPVGIIGGKFSRDGRGVYFASNRDSEFHRLRYVDLRKRRETVISGEIPWDVELMDLSDDGRWLAYVTNEDGIGKLHLYSLVREAEVSVPELPSGPIEVLAFDKSSMRLGMTIATATSPRDIYVLELSTGEVDMWTRSETGGLHTLDFVRPELIRYPTFDDAVPGQPRLIPAFVYRPKGDGPHPVLIHVHGGPESQFRPRFRAIFQYFIRELGLAIIAPNVRGSSGYGDTYLGLDNGAWREDAVKDLGALLDWIATQQDLDANRVVVWGASYGGYMTLSSLMNFSDRFIGGVDVFGISNFVTFLESTSEYRQDLRRQEYGDERDPVMRAYLNDISPTTNATQIKRPLLVVQGLNDPRVPVSESEQMVSTIRRNGGEVWYLLAKNEGHGFDRQENRVAYYATMALFLKTLLERSEP